MLDSRLKDLLKKCSFLLKKKMYLKDLKKSKKGLSNDHYIIDDCYFLRLPKLIKRPDYDPLQEARIEDKFGRYLHPSINNIYFDKVTGIKLCNYIQDFQEFDNKHLTFTDVRYIALALTSLHSLPYKGIKDFNIKRKIKLYRKAAKVLPLKEEKAILESYQKYENDSKVLCHNDLVQGNILIINRKVELIDFEYAMANDPYFDLASFISENNIKDPLIRKFFLEQYFKKPISDEQYEKLQVFINLNNLLWYYWALMMNQISPNKIYLVIAKEKKNNLKIS